MITNGEGHGFQPTDLFSTTNYIRTNSGRVLTIVKPMVKAILRHQLLKKRTQQVADPLPLIEGICSHIRQHGITTVAAYTPTETEPGGGRMLLDALRKVTPTLYLPATTSQHQMVWGEYLGPESLTIGAFHIPEPRNAPHPSSILATCGLVLVPGLAGTPSGIRLGRGGGFYDRALSGIDRARTRLAVVLHPWEVLDEIPFEPHDIVMDLIFTAEGTISCQKDI